jgi:hypothetical protein
MASPPERKYALCNRDHALPLGEAYQRGCKIPERKLDTQV